LGVVAELAECKGPAPMRITQEVASLRHRQLPLICRLQRSDRLAIPGQCSSVLTAVPQAVSEVAIRSAELHGKVNHTGIVMDELLTQCAKFLIGLHCLGRSAKLRERKGTDIACIDQEKHCLLQRSLPFAHWPQCGKCFIVPLQCAAKVPDATQGN